ncbi:MAG TPA: hypothetical protein DCQ92_02740 [Verrucomicrobia subdivision 3 bacterium]|nr:hypothetical protein [Limisphaerales bacterium]
MKKPNGITGTPDGKKLFVSDSHASIARKSLASKRSKSESRMQNAEETLAVVEDGGQFVAIGEQHAALQNGAGELAERILPKLAP